MKKTNYDLTKRNKLYEIRMTNDMSIAEKQIRDLSMNRSGSSSLDESNISCVLSSPEKKSPSCEKEKNPQTASTVEEIFDNKNPANRSSSTPNKRSQNCEMGNTHQKTIQMLPPSYQLMHQEALLNQNLPREKEYDELGHLDKLSPKAMDQLDHVFTRLKVLYDIEVYWDKGVVYASTATYDERDEEGQAKNLAETRKNPQEADNYGLPPINQAEDDSDTPHCSTPYGKYARGRESEIPLWKRTKAMRAHAKTDEESMSSDKRKEFSDAYEKMAKSYPWLKEIIPGGNGMSMIDWFRREKTCPTKKDVEYSDTKSTAIKKQYALAVVMGLHRCLETFPESVNGSPNDSAEEKDTSTTDTS